MEEEQSRRKLPWILAGLGVLGMGCGCAGLIGGYLYYRSLGQEGEEWVAMRRAALSGHGHTDPFSAPSGAVVHINQTEVLAPRDLDVQIIGSLLGRDLGAAVRKDALPGNPAEVDLYQDPGDGQPCRVEIDLDRDGKIDEKWKIEGDRIRRAISSADNEDYDSMWRWQQNLWLKESGG